MRDCTSGAISAPAEESSPSARATARSAACAAASVRRSPGGSGATGNANSREASSPRYRASHAAKAGGVVRGSVSSIESRRMGAGPIIAAPGVMRSRIQNAETQNGRTRNDGAHRGETDADARNPLL